MEKLIDISSYPVANVLNLLLQDKSTKKNIIWATDTYEEFGEGFTDKEQMDANALLRRTDIIRPRIQKSMEAQAQRTRKKAEVFTPAWLCNRMNNHCDEDWFGRAGVFNIENEDHTWTVTEGRIEFPKRKKWQHYVDSRRLEITCGEAPYLVSRYDVSTGELIVPPVRRIGMLDRKLRIVNENTDTYEDWLKWTIRAFEASYGYEYQGDNVLIARINLLLTFLDYYEERWERRPDDKLLEQISNRIAWNIWQMDGLKDTVPLGKPYEEYKQLTLLDMFALEDISEGEPETVPCRIFNWRSKSSLKFMDIKEMRVVGKKLFDYVIGNPPYQDDTVGGNDNYAPQVYNKFLDSAYQVAQKVEMVHPARFLFNAGSTPKEWNQRMLNDPHFKVLKYVSDSQEVFPNIQLTGGVAISYHDSEKDYGAIRVFTPFDELNSILNKVASSADFISMESVVITRTIYRLTDKMHDEHPEARYKENDLGENIGCLSKGHDYDMSSNIFDCIPQVFFTDDPNDGNTYIAMLGRKDGERSYMYIRKDYVDVDRAKNFEKYKVVLARADGAAGTIGKPIPARIIGAPIIEKPRVGTTESFLSIGCCDTENEVNNLLKYIKSKFMRALVGVLKITQDINPGKWKYVPLQDFTASSDIDWSKSVHEIDLQLYQKYGLDEKEIEFIESHVKEMA